MVYDPIRDCEVPSPATSTGPGSGWREGRTPGSEGTAMGYSSHSYTHHAQYGHPAPPAFNGGSRSPGPSRSVSGGALRGLLNDEDGSRNSDPRSSVSSNAAGPADDSYGPSAGGSRHPYGHMLNLTPSAQPVSKSNSASSAARSSPPSHASPSHRHHHLDPNAFLTPATPANAGMRSSRSPHPMSIEQISPAAGYQGLPHAQDYHDTAGPSSRRTSGGGQRVMPPPQEIPQHYDYRSTPTGTGLPLRSPSVSVSPRGHQASLPPGYPTSRPGSSSASRDFAFYPPASASPSNVHRRLSEDISRPGTGETHPARRSTLPARSDSQAPLYSPAYQPQSLSPAVAPTPYEPKRLTRPTSLNYPIQPEEVARFKAMGMANNPLRKRKPKPTPSWSGPSSSSSRMPNESDTSYFPAPTDRRGSISSTARASTTPGPARDRASNTPMEQRSVSNGKGQRAYDGPGQPLGVAEPRSSKRHHEPEVEAGHDAGRRKVGGAGAYVGIPGQVADHYNSRAEVGVVAREFSPIIGLKKFNNWVKSVLIGKFAFRPRGAPGANILDIGCGKGGDLKKWKQARIRLYVGLDIAATSIEQAWGRYQEVQNAFEAHFFAHDCFSRSLKEVLPPQLAQPELYDNVTMQFCMHYAFETASKARMMMENVSRYLRRGGVFIGTIPDANLLLAKLATEVPEDAETLRFGNNCYSVEFVEREHKGVFGHQYSFYLQDAIDDVPEYLVDWDNFVALAAEYRLRLVYKKSFGDILAEEQGSRDFGPLLKRMKVIDEYGQSSMDDDQWEAANLYMAFAFEKT